MNTKNIIESVRRLKKKRLALERAIYELCWVLSGRTKKSYAQLAYEIIMETGKPIHIFELVQEFGRIGILVTKGSLAASLTNYLNRTGKSGLLKKVSPGIYGINEENLA